MLVFTESNLAEFQVGYLALFRPFSVTHGFDWFQLMLMFLKASFLVLHLLYINDLPDDVFRMMSSVILLPMLMVLLSTVRVISYSMWQ